MQAFFSALVTFFEEKMPLISDVFAQTIATYGNESHLNLLRKSICEKFLIKVSIQHKEHVMLEFCDQVSIEMQTKLFKESFHENIR